MSLRDSLQTPAYTAAAASSSSLITPSLSALSDPPVRLADAAALDYLGIEMVHTLRDSSRTALARIRELENEMRDAGLDPSPAPPEKAPALKDKERLKNDGRDSPGGVRMRVASSMGTVSGVEVEVDEEEQNLRLRLEAIGLHVGANIAERSVLSYPLIYVRMLLFIHALGRLCRERPRFNDTLDAVKFVCKDVWATCWDKQVDNLRTNHRVRRSLCRHADLYPSEHACSSRASMYYKTINSSP